MSLSANTRQKSIFLFALDREEKNDIKIEEEVNIRNWFLVKRKIALILEFLRTKVQTFIYMKTERDNPPGFPGK